MTTSIITNDHSILCFMTLIGIKLVMFNILGNEMIFWYLICSVFMINHRVVIWTLNLEIELIESKGTKLII